MIFIFKTNDKELIGKSGMVWDFMENIEKLKVASVLFTLFHNDFPVHNTKLIYCP